MTDYGKPAFFIILVFGLIIFFNLKFDTQPLKGVNMEPFAEPIQEIIKDGTPFNININGINAKITPLAAYRVYGRVHAQHYLPPQYAYSPVIPFDVALGWKDLATKEAFRYVKIKQYKRTSTWITGWGTPFNCKQIQSMYSNNHLIPANTNIFNAIKHLKRKDVVYLEGKLVNAEIMKDGRVENIDTSLSREDTKCEVIYVTRIVTNKGDFR
ncbi:MAG: hypothetical protein ACI37R_06895 [Candidatus Avigastranaerophilus sp.]